KGYYSFSNAGPNTFRRCWGQWMQSIANGPKQGMSFTYYAYQTLVENGIFCWNDSSMPDPYKLRDASGNIITTYSPPGSGCSVGLPDGVVQADGSCQISNQQVDQPYAPLSHDNPVGSKSVFCRIYGNICYGVAPTAGADIPQRLTFITLLDQVAIKDTIMIYPNTATFAGKNTFGLFAGTAHTGLTITNATSFKGLSSGLSIHGDWLRTNVAEATTPAALYVGVGETMYNTTQGASIRYRYVDGVLTGTALWPWPMNARILAAMALSTYTPVDVNATITGFFGAPPP
ncbi:MAG TPA: hypothetical protein VN903_35555, partial [Polyangia bacterium]|nr:hypothetical protein [Polyangia bacterium]